MVSSIIQDDAAQPGKRKSGEHQSIGFDAHSTDHQGDQVELQEHVGELNSSDMKEVGEKLAEERDQT